MKIEIDASEIKSLLSVIKKIKPTLDELKFLESIDGFWRIDFRKVEDEFPTCGERMTDDENCT